MLSLSAVPGQSLTFTLVEALGHAIVSGRFDDGGFPSEAALAHRYGTSRSVVREALRTLAAKGLLSRRQHVGATVQPSTSWHLLDPDVVRWQLHRQVSPELLRAFAEMRLAFEPEAADLASRREPAAPKGAVQGALDHMAAAAKGVADPKTAELAFHLAVLDAADNPFLTQLKPFLTTAATHSARFTHRISGPAGGLGARRLVAQAVLSGAPAVARDRMRSLLLDEAGLIERQAPSGRRP